jgi:hypothetical protein
MAGTTWGARDGTLHHSAAAAPAGFGGLAAGVAACQKRAPPTIVKARCAHALLAPSSPPSASTARRAGAGPGSAGRGARFASRRRGRHRHRGGGRAIARDNSRGRRTSLRPRRRRGNQIVRSTTRRAFGRLGIARQQCQDRQAVPTVEARRPTGSGCSTSTYRGDDRQPQAANQLRQAAGGSSTSPRS